MAESNKTLTMEEDLETELQKLEISKIDVDDLDPGWKKNLKKFEEMDFKKLNINQLELVTNAFLNRKSRPNFADDNDRKDDDDDEIEETVGYGGVEDYEKLKSLPYHSSVRKIDDKKPKSLSELQCPFTWSLPRAGIVPSDMVAKLTQKDKEIEDGDQFKMRNFVCNIVIVYELYNDNKKATANKKLIDMVTEFCELYSKCEEDFFRNMKRSIHHVILACKAYLVAAFSYSISILASCYRRNLEKVISNILPYSEMTKSEQAGIFGLKAQVFSEYGYSGSLQALEYAKKAVELDPNEAEWYFLTGKIIGRLRRFTNWNDYVGREEIKLLEQAVELREKPAFLVFLASAYSECTKTIFRKAEFSDGDLNKKLETTNLRAIDLYMRCLELNPSCPHINIRCAYGLMKLPKYLMDVDTVRNCIKCALDKAPHNGMAHHVAGMFAERYERDIEKALHHYGISSDLHLYGAMADLLRVKYKYERDFDLLSSLENMLDIFDELPNKHKTLSCIGSYYLFLKRDLIAALNYYVRIMDEDRDSSALKAHKPLFLYIRGAFNLYEILCTEAHLELKNEKLSAEEKSALQEFLIKLNKIDPEISEKFANEPSRIQNIMDETRSNNQRQKAILRKQQDRNFYKRRDDGFYQSNDGDLMRGTNGRGRGRGGRGRGGQNVRKQNDSNADRVGSWRNKDNDENKFFGKREDWKLRGDMGAEIGEFGDTSYSKKNENRLRTLSTGSNGNENPATDKECDVENKPVHTFKKNRTVHTIRDPYGPNEGGIQKSFERKRVPNKNWITKIQQQ